jgi:hypothetical protein
MPGSTTLLSSKPSATIYCSTGQKQSNYYFLKHTTGYAQTNH